MGPILVLDTQETGNFFERWKQVEPSISFGGLIGFGVDIFLPARTLLSMSFGYDYLPMRGEVDGRRDYSGISLKFLVGKLKK